MQVLKAQGKNGAVTAVRCAFNAIINYRYPIALVVFVLLVLFKVNGSSIDIWKNYVDTTGKSTVALGADRDIRSDEWEVLLPVYLSQVNSDQPFEIVNKSMTTSGQNIVVTMGAPIKDIYSISKPLHWGFMLFGVDYGLAWYWNLKLILILLLSYELSMILTKGNRLISALGSIWIAFAPAVQWWFTQHVGDNVLYMEAIVVTFYYFFKFFDKPILKIVFAFLFGLSCVGYIIPLYPPLQITFGFLAIILMVLIFVDFKKKISFKKYDFAIIGCTALFVMLMVGHLYLILKDALPLITNTVYPGKRVALSGQGATYGIFSFLTNLFLPYSNNEQLSKLTTNQCELSSFYNFLPAVLLALPVFIKRRRSGSSGMLKYGIALSIFAVFFAAYINIQFIPEAIAKITLLSRVTSNRAIIVYSYASALLSIWALSQLVRMGGLNRIYALTVSGAVAVLYYVAVRYMGLKGDVRLRYFLVVILFMVLLTYLLLRGRRIAFSVLMGCFVLASGVAVNPINIGTGAISDSKIAEEIRQVDKSDPTATWMSVDDVKDRLGWIGVLIYANGAKSIGGINNYPDYAKWSKLDPSRQYVKIYNRSAHITYRIVNTKTSFELLGTNAFRVNINIDDLKKLNVKYIVSGDNLDESNSGDVSFKPMFAADAQNLNVYQVSYA